MRFSTIALQKLIVDEHPNAAFSWPASLSGPNGINPTPDPVQFRIFLVLMTGMTIKRQHPFDDSAVHEALKGREIRP